MEWILELFLVLLLMATLFQAIRLERALGVLRRDRGALEGLVAGFNASTRQAESGIERLRSAADGAGRLIEKQIEASVSLKDDLAFLTERGDRLADRLDVLVRSARPLTAEPVVVMSPPATTTPTSLPAHRSSAEKGLLHALRLAR